MIRKTNRPMPDPNDPLYAPDPPTPAEAEVAIEMRNAKVRDALSSLSTDQRTAVHLAFFEGLSHAEVAKSMDTPLGTVKSRLRLAAARLRGALSDEFKEELLND
jgi:RNA polymerase sigma-70 factor (ECF subfamily)